MHPFLGYHLEQPYRVIRADPLFHDVFVGGQAPAFDPVPYNPAINTHEKAWGLKSALEKGR